MMAARHEPKPKPLTIERPRAVRKINPPYARQELRAGRQVGLRVAARRAVLLVFVYGNGGLLGAADLVS